LHAPDFLFLDEATASVDEAAEARLYRLIEQKLPQTTVVSIGHRSTLRAFHSRGAELAAEADHFTLRPGSTTEPRPAE
jgi:putative ATP-binding cassette transporter